MALLSFGIFFATGQGGGGALTSIGQNLSIAGGLQLNTGSGAKPTCNESNRGMMWTEKGGSGEQDIMVFCGKHADGQFQWIKYASMWKSTVATGGDSVYTFVADGSNGIAGVTYRVHEFTTVGNSSFVVTDPGTDGVEYLVIGGGGASNGNRSGGGGAGGYRSSVAGERSGGDSDPEEPLLLSADTYAVTVGAGGAAGPWNARNNGENSVFGDIVSLGGGVGGTRQSNSALALPPGDGGSGGGSVDISTGGGGTYVEGQGEYRQGFNGGLGGGGGSAATSGGGGGGAGQPGNVPSFTGGDGLESSITGTPIFRGGGGGGGGTSGTLTGGLGGGGTGTGAVGAGGAGVNGTGGGAGGGRDVSTGAAGGSGIVIIRYPITNPYQ